VTTLSRPADALHKVITFARITRISEPEPAFCKCEPGADVPADHRLTIGDSAGFTEKVAWRVPSTSKPIEVYVLLDKGDLDIDGTFRLDKVGAGINGGAAYQDADVTAGQLHAPSPCL
jgi:hypothetical protein